MNIATLKEAIQADKNGDALTAIKKYVLVVEQRLKSLKDCHELTDEAKCSVIRDLEEYIQRSEDLQEALQKYRSDIDPEYCAKLRQASAFDDHTEPYFKMKMRLRIETKMESFSATLNEIIGAEEVKTSLRQGLVYPLTSPEYFSEHSGRMPLSTVLLFGSPGVAKTSLAMAAGAAVKENCEMFQLKPTSISSSWAGHSKKLLSAFFDMVKECSPAIILADELEDLFQARVQEGKNGGSDLSSELLIQLNNIQMGNEVFFIGCCNHPELLDRGFLRRFSPNVREKIIILLHAIDLTLNFNPLYRSSMSLCQINLIDNQFWNCNYLKSNME